MIYTTFFQNEYTKYGHDSAWIEYAALNVPDLCTVSNGKPPMKVLENEIKNNNSDYYSVF